jgi:hypothetical protein
MDKDERQRAAEVVLVDALIDQHEVGIVEDSDITHVFKGGGTSVNAGPIQ